MQGLSFLWLFYGNFSTLGYPLYIKIPSLGTNHVVYQFQHTNSATWLSFIVSLGFPMCRPGQIPNLEAVLKCQNWTKGGGILSVNIPWVACPSPLPPISRKTHDKCTILLTIVEGGSYHLHMSSGWSFLRKRFISAPGFREAGRELWVT